MRDGLTAQYIAGEQADFAGILRTLPPAAWGEPSLCAGWTVRQVVVHVAAHVHDQQRDVTVLDHFSRCPEQELIAYLESPPHESDDATLTVRRRSAEIQRGELMIHQQDVRRTLGMARSIPSDGDLEPLLMATAGRTVALEELDGPGVGVLGDRIRNPSPVLRDLNDYAAIVNPL